jgi:23S rRNA (cytosine1962-C5)-methyltransferase
MLLETFYAGPPWDFSLLDTGNGYRLEQWGKIRLARPDPQIIWEPSMPQSEWDRADARFEGKSEAHPWKTANKIPTAWTVNFGAVKLRARLTPFKHTGIFAEQAANWDWMAKQLGGANSKKQLSVLNLFGYTGAATMVLAKAGHFVTHLDASRPAITWAKENQRLNALPEKSIRWMLDDAAKFVQREIKRGKQYDGILMDPPAFGHSPTGKTWKFNKDLPPLLANCVQLLSPDAKFLLINGYATNSSAIALNNILEDEMKKRPELGGDVEYGELCLQHPVVGSASDGTRKNQRLISTGIFSRWGAAMSIAATSRAVRK